MPDGSIVIDNRNAEDLASPLALCISEMSNVIQSGHLPAQGGWMDQPAKLIQGIKIMRAATRKAEERIEQKRG